MIIAMVEGAIRAGGKIDMERDGVLNAKAEIFTEAFGFDEVPAAQEVDSTPMFAARRGSETFHSMALKRHLGRRDARDLIALGTLNPDRDRDRSGAKLGIFIQRLRLSQHPIVERAREMAAGEARVILTGPIRRQSPVRPGRCRPLEVGTSIGHHLTTAGTLGCFVRRRIDGKLGILSNNHVLANTNHGRIGDVILQPAPSDGGRLDSVADRVATLCDMIPIDFGVDGINFVDAAMATLIDGMQCSPRHVAHGTMSWAIGDIDPLMFERQSVVKMGRTTGPTRGFVQAVNIDNLLVSYRFGQKFGIARFDRQISIAGDKRAFSSGGDSGSLVCSEAGQPVALLMAGSKTGGTSGRGLTFASPIEAVTDALGIDICVDV